MITLPEYVDGCFDLYRVEDDTSKDYPEKKLKNENMSIWFREISVFDRTRYEFDQGDKEITMKVRIPMYKHVDSNCVCVIDERQHQVYNATHVTDKNGFPETELTLIRPETELVIA